MRKLLFSAAILLQPLAAAGVTDIDTFWEYGDPAASERRFRGALASATGDERLELMTQIARTHSLRRAFRAAHAELDEVERQLPSAGAAPRVRYCLERGRTFNAEGERARASPLFVQAWETATAAGLDGLAVDAAHMLAIIEPPADAARWTERGVALARRTSDPKARGLLPALLNNHAWNLHDAARYEEALATFREAESAWHATGRQPQGRIATWSVARALRSLQHHEEALALQLELEGAWATEGAADGYVFEEIAENLEALGRAREATAYFARAAAEFGKSDRFAREAPERWQRITAMARRVP